MVFKMAHFLIFLAELAIINIILFTLITLIASKLVLLKKNKFKEEKSSDIFHKIPFEKLSVLGFEKEKYPVREIIQAEERHGGFVWKKITFPSPKEDFWGKSVFDKHLKELERQGFVIKRAKKEMKLDEKILEYPRYARNEK